MTADEFRKFQERLGISRAELSRRLGIAENTATAYAHGRQPIPKVVQLACAALALGITLPEEFTKDD